MDPLSIGGAVLIVCPIAAIIRYRDPTPPLNTRACRALGALHTPSSLLLLSSAARPPQLDPRRTCLGVSPIRCPPSRSRQALPTCSPSLMPYSSLFRPLRPSAAALAPHLHEQRRLRLPDISALLPLTSRKRTQRDDGLREGSACTMRRRSAPSAAPRAQPPCCHGFTTWPPQPSTPPSRFRIATRWMDVGAQTLGISQKLPPLFSEAQEDSEKYCKNAGFVYMDSLLMPPYSSSLRFPLLL
ncbi:hypothetical protein B0H19DRAFT_1252419 [Mycena capillaripes]|nr:hypothetical protein B0H19DRAFT_1252419 [Mycena capillaripes]